jgi:predicted RNA polymerase sigma factor
MKLYYSPGNCSLPPHDTRGHIERPAEGQQLAEDILHDVFLKALTKLEAVRQPENLRGWLYQVTRNGRRKSDVTQSSLKAKD